MNSAGGEKEAGFTLLEVLVALVIVALALSALTRSIGGAYRVAGRTKSYATAIVAARSQLAQVGIDRPLQAGTFAGIYSNRVRWRMTISSLDKKPTGEPDAAPPAFPAYWILLEVLDRRGKDVFVLETAKVAGTMP